MANKITYTAMRKELVAAGLKVTKDDGEIRVAFPGNESAAYYTNDAEDALNTGRAMLAEQRPADDVEGQAIEAGDHTPGAPFDEQAYLTERRAELAAELAEVDSELAEHIEPETFETLAADLGLELTATNIATRPDAAGSDWDKTAIHFHVTVTKPDTTPGFKANRAPVVIWSGNYSVGSAHPMLWAQRGCKYIRDGKVKQHSHARSAYRQMDKKGAYSTRGMTVYDAGFYNRIVDSFKAVAPLEIADILNSLACDSRDWESTFEDWAEMLGYDTDSRRAYDVYTACQNTAKTLRAALGSADFERLLNAEES